MPGCGARFSVPRSHSCEHFFCPAPEAFTLEPEAFTRVFCSADSGGKHRCGCGARFSAPCCTHANTSFARRRSVHAGAGGGHTSVFAARDSGGKHRCGCGARFSVPCSHSMPNILLPGAGAFTLGPEAFSRVLSTARDSADRRMCRTLQRAVFALMRRLPCSGLRRRSHECERGTQGVRAPRTYDETVAMQRPARPPVKL